MEVSTPINNKGNSLRRRTLMKLVDTPITSEPVNDESERSSRRSIIEIQKKQQVAQSPSLNDSVRFSGEQEIKDHFQICSKLFAENKITVGVAWQLQIIDLLRVVSKKQSSNTLQVASTSLDIGAKVYSIRVDDVHAEGLKLASSMARFAEKNQVQEKDNEGDGDGEENNDEAAQPVKKKKKKLRYTGGVKNTIVKDHSSLLAPIPELESVLFSNRIDSNLSTVDNLFTNSLPMDKSCYKLLALGDEKAWATGPDEAVEGLEEVKSFDIDLLPKGGHICIPFQNFILNQWNPDEEEQNAEINDALGNDILVYDDRGIPVAELDGSIHDVFNDVDLPEGDDDEPQTEDFIVQQIQHDVAYVTDLMKTQSELQKSEYSYNSIITIGNGKVIDQIWAGPSHWKLKFLRRSKARFSGKVDNQTVARPKTKKLKEKEEGPIELDDSEDMEKLFEKLKRIKIKKKIYPANKITLPLADVSSRSMINDAYELMIKPGTVPIAKSDNTLRVENTQENFDNEGHLETDNNDADLDNGMDLMDHMDNDPGNDIEEEEMAINREQNFMGDNLVDAPEYVPKVYIPYALQAKKMDIKKLKGFIWQQLTQSSIMQSKKVVPNTFSQIYADLPTILPQAMKKELSCSLAFAALLHLCNEETLKLTSLPGNKDFNIESG